MTLQEKQVNELAKIFAGMTNSMMEFFENPQNKKEYQEWYLKKYGRLPAEVK